MASVKTKLAKAKKNESGVVNMSLGGEVTYIDVPIYSNGVLVDTWQFSADGYDTMKVIIKLLGMSSVSNKRLSMEEKAAHFEEVETLLDTLFGEGTFKYIYESTPSKNGKKNITDVMANIENLMQFVYAKMEGTIDVDEDTSDNTLDKYVIDDE